MEWQYDHFQLETESYIFLDEDLGDRDLSAYRKLIRYVNNFVLGMCVLPNGDQLYDEGGQPFLVARYINTKVVLECETKGEAMTLLGRIYVNLIIFLCLFRVDFVFSV